MVTHSGSCPAGLPAAAALGSSEKTAFMSPRLRSRDEVIAGLRGHNISARAYFSPPVHQLARYRGRLRRDLHLSWTEYVSDSVRVLPVHPEEPPTVAGETAAIVRSLAR